jgi:hypothetical protein
MGILTRIAAALLAALRWLLLAVASGAVWLADPPDDAAKRLRR